MRKELYFRDGDFRLSYLHGHYVTMTNYDRNFNGVHVVYDKLNLSDTLGETISKNSFSQRFFFRHLGK